MNQEVIATLYFSTLVKNAVGSCMFCTVKLGFWSKLLRLPPFL